MRPVRLELKDFGSFRGPVVVDFDDVELFVLAGPTGAGKTTIIDAMCFALYGSVPRYDHANLKEPVINRTAAEARLRFDFTIGEQRLRAGWVVKRGAGGRVSSDARLERVLPELDAAGEPTTTTLASGSRELREASERLLGLTFEEFTKTVVLPQGAFAELLHGGRVERQNLLVRLLDLEIYREIGQAARSRADVARGRIEHLGRQVEELAGATDAAIADATERVDALSAVRSEVDEALPRLTELRERYATAQGTATQLEARVEALTTVARPAGVDDLAGRLAAANEQVTTTADAAARAQARAEDAARTAEELPAAHDLAAVREADAARLAAEDRCRAGTEEAAAAAKAADDATEAVTEAARRRDQAAAAVEHLRRDHLAATLARDLAAGDDCPVCRRRLDEPPDHPLPADLEAAERAAAEARAAADAALERASLARARASELAAAAHAARERADDARVALATAASRLPGDVLGDDGTVDEGALAALETRRAEADRLLESQRAAAGQAADDHRRAREAVTALEAEERAAWAAFDTVRDTVAGFGAPRPDRRDLAGAWDELLSWSGQAAAAATDELASARSHVEAVQQEGLAQGRAIRDLVVGAGIDLPDDAKPQDAVAALGGAQQQAATHVEQLREQVRRRTTLQGERDELTATLEVAEALGEVLRKDRFEKWLLNRLSVRLVVGASSILRELTDGTYSLTLDDAGTFAVIDHANADESRSARTLSGGETFLASLALALALAEHVASINRQGAARLDALFLDEGFGTLDADALDTVASAIEDLSRRQERMVGIITHVRDLAERIPVRYEVTKGPEGSTVRKVVPAGVPTGVPEGLP